MRHAGPRISLIAAMTRQRVIGIENRLPWKLPADMKWFRQHTLGKPVIMGRKTYESFGARPLPERLNVVVTRDVTYSPAAHENLRIAHSIEEAIRTSGDVEEVMIIGGASFYEQTLPMADRLYLTQVDAEIKGDAWFPAWQAADWQCIEQHEYAVDERNSYAMRFEILDRARR